MFPTDAFVSSSSPEVLTASKSRCDKTVFEPLSSSRVGEESSLFSSDTLKVSVKENEVPTEKNSSRASIFATKASYISN